MSKQWQYIKDDSIIYVTRPDGSKFFFVEFKDDDDEEDVKKFVDAMNGEAKAIEDFSDAEISEQFYDRDLEEEDEEEYPIGGLIDKQKMDFLYENLGNISLEDLERLVKFNTVK